MKFKQIINTAKLKLDKNSPEILVVTGVVGMIGATVLACRATIKAMDIKKDKENKLSIVDACEESGMVDENQEYTAEDAAKDRKAIKVQATVNYIRAYAPAVLLGGVSIFSILYGHNILRKRYLSLGAAYTALDKAYAEYRKRVEEKYGEDAEKEIRYGIEKQKDEEGNETQVINGNLYGPWAKFFDSSCRPWTKNADTNLYFLKTQQAQFNNRLKEVGHVYLNEIYRALDLPETAEGQQFGWIFDKDHQDAFIDFGMYKLGDPSSRRFVNGYEAVILLDFNVMGNILGHMQKEKDVKKM